MVTNQERPKRKETGGRYRDYRKKRHYNMGDSPSSTGIGEKKVRVKRERSGSLKFSLLNANTINAYNPKTKKYAIAKVKTIVENKANRHFVRRNIMTKGAIVETDLGKVKVTSRPGQTNSVNGTLI
jgi:small subunit ribosomal protein S8e